MPTKNIDKRSGIAERKERVTRDNKYDASCEVAAQGNSRGGMIVVGLPDSPVSSWAPPRGVYNNMDKTARQK